MKANIPKNRPEEFIAMSLSKEEGGGKVNYPVALWDDEKTNESLLYTYAGFSQVADKNGVFTADFSSTAERIQLSQEALKQGLATLMSMRNVVPLDEENRYQFIPYKAATIRK